jgi:hypothetical protein
MDVRPPNVLADGVQQVDDGQLPVAGDRLNLLFDHVNDRGAEGQVVLGDHGE